MLIQEERLNPSETDAGGQESTHIENVKTVAKDPRYAKYFKMVQVVRTFSHIIH